MSRKRLSEGNQVQVEGFRMADYLKDSKEHSDVHITRSSTTGFGFL